MSISPERPINKVFWRFFRQGLTIDVRNSQYPVTFGDANKLIHIPQGTVVGGIAFEPDEMKDYDPTRRVFASTAFLIGLEFFFRELERRPDSYPTYLTGTTNEQMMRFVNRLGFETIETSVLNDKKYIVIGETSKIKDNEVRNRIVKRRLHDRIMKEIEK